MKEIIIAVLYLYNITYKASTEVFKGRGVNSIAVTDIGDNE